MKCVICKLGETRPGHTAITIERDNSASQYIHNAL